MSDKEKPELPEHLKLFQDPHHLRGDARMVARLMSLGVISQEQSEHILKEAFRLAAEAADKGNVRHFISLCRLAQSGAKLEIEYLNAVGKRLPVQQLVSPPNRPDEETEGSNSVAFIESPPMEDLKATFRVLRELGILDEMAKDEEQPDATQVIDAEVTPISPEEETSESNGEGRSGSEDV